MTQSVEIDIAFDPVKIGLLRAHSIPTQPKFSTNMIQKWTLSMSAPPMRPIAIYHIYIQYIFLMSSVHARIEAGVCTFGAGISVQNSALSWTYEYCAVGYRAQAFTQIHMLVFNEGDWL